MRLRKFAHAFSSGSSESERGEKCALRNKQNSLHSEWGNLLEYVLHSTAKEKKTRSIMLHETYKWVQTINEWVWCVKWIIIYPISTWKLPTVNEQSNFSAFSVFFCFIYFRHWLFCRLLVGTNTVTRRHASFISNSQKKTKLSGPQLMCAQCRKELVKPRSRQATRHKVIVQVVSGNAVYKKPFSAISLHTLQYEREFSALYTLSKN